MELVGSMRCLDKTHDEICSNLRQGRTDGLMDYLLDHKLTRQDDVLFHDAPIISPGNPERYYINFKEIQRFAACHNRKVIVWLLRVHYAKGTGSFQKDILDCSGNPIACLQQLQSHEPQLFGYFCAGAPCCLTVNINTSCGLANGVQATMYSLVWPTKELTEEVTTIVDSMDENQMVFLPIGLEPCQVLVRPQLSESLKENWPAELSVVANDVIVPISYQSKTIELRNPQKCFVKVELLNLDLAFIGTVHKAEGLSVEKLIVSLLRRPVTPYFPDFNTMYVAITRVRQGNQFRILCNNRKQNGDLDYVSALKPSTHLVAFLHGYNDDGLWDSKRAQEKLTDLGLPKEDIATQSLHTKSKTAKKTARTSSTVRTNKISQIRHAASSKQESLPPLFITSSTSDHQQKTSRNADVQLSSAPTDPPLAIQCGKLSLILFDRQEMNSFGDIENASSNADDFFKKLNASGIQFLLGCKLTWQETFYSGVTVCGICALAACARVNDIRQGVEENKWKQHGWSKAAMRETIRTYVNANLAQYLQLQETNPSLDISNGLQFLQKLLVWLDGADEVFPQEFWPDQSFVENWDSQYTKHIWYSIGTGDDDMSYMQRKFPEVHSTFSLQELIAYSLDEHIGHSLGHFYNLPVAKDMADLPMAIKTYFNGKAQLQRGTSARNKQPGAFAVSALTTRQETTDCENIEPPSRDMLLSTICYQNCVLEATEERGSMKAFIQLLVENKQKNGTYSSLFAIGNTQRNKILKLKFKLMFIPTAAVLDCPKLTVGNGSCSIATLEYLSATYHDTIPVFGSADRWEDLATKRINAPAASSYIRQHLPEFIDNTVRNNLDLTETNDYDLRYYPETVLTFLQNENDELTVQWGSYLMFQNWELEIPRVLWSAGMGNLNNNFTLIVASTREHIEDSQRRVVKTSNMWTIQQMFDLLGDTTLLHAGFQSGHFFPLPKAEIKTPTLAQLEVLLTILVDEQTNLS